MLKQFESTLREVLTEHSQNKEKTIKTSNFKKMFTICQQSTLPVDIFRFHLERELKKYSYNVFS